jgi:hypothetical protein
MASYHFIPGCNGIYRCPGGKERVGNFQTASTHISQIVIDVENEIYILENVILRGEYSK